MWKLKQPKLAAQRGFGAADVRGMIDVVARQFTNPLRDTAIILLLFDTGIRRSEVCRLRLADVIEGDHMASSVTVHGKGDKDRRIEIWPESAGFVHPARLCRFRCTSFDVSLQPRQENTSAPAARCPKSI
jgi:integrase